MPRQNLLLFRSKSQAENLDEQEVIRACLEGDRQAFEKIVERYRDKVYWTAFNLVLDSEDARDVAQQSFIKIWKSLPEYDFEKSFSGWVSKIAANSAIDFLRARKVSEPLEETIPAERSTIDQDLDIRKMFHRIAPMLSERQRIALVLREIHEMEISEIADLMQCTESTVRNLLSQAKDSFRRKAKELFPDYGL
jgi:RNA polymerase sigma-70 factor (ECF subfamily)